MEKNIWFDCNSLLPLAFPMRYWGREGWVAVKILYWVSGTECMQSSRPITYYLSMRAKSCKVLTWHLSHQDMYNKLKLNKVPKHHLSLILILKPILAWQCLYSFNKTLRWPLNPLTSSHRLVSLWSVGLWFWFCSICFNPSISWWQCGRTGLIVG